MHSTPAPSDPLLLREWIRDRIRALLEAGGLTLNERGWFDPAQRELLDLLPGLRAAICSSWAYRLRDRDRADRIRDLCERLQLWFLGAAGSDPVRRLTKSVLKGMAAGVAPEAAFYSDLEGRIRQLLHRWRKGREKRAMVAYCDPGAMAEQLAAS